MCNLIYHNQRINFLHFVDVDNRNENTNKSSKHEKCKKLKCFLEVYKWHQ